MRNFHFIRLVHSTTQWINLHNKLQMLETPLSENVEQSIPNPVIDELRKELLYLIHQQSLRCQAKTALTASISSFCRNPLTASPVADHAGGDAGRLGNKPHSRTLLSKSQRGAIGSVRLHHRKYASLGCNGLCS